MKINYPNHNYLKLTLRLISLFVFCYTANAQQPYFRQIATIDDYGKGKNNCIYQDKQGFIWIGATTGAYRFDGLGFNALEIPDSILNKSVSAIFEDSQSRLWFGLEDGNILQSDRFQTVVFKMQNELPTCKITAITEDENGILWFGTYGGGIFAYPNDNLIKINSGSGLSDDYICITG